MVKIDAAIGKIQEGTYICEDCGGKISEERLVLPFAMLTNFLIDLFHSEIYIKYNVIYVQGEYMERIKTTEIRKTFLKH